MHLKRAVSDFVYLFPQRPGPNWNHNSGASEQDPEQHPGNEGPGAAAAGKDGSCLSQR